MTIECPNSIEELEELEEALPLCRKALFEQAQARVKTGEAKSEREASRQLAEELDIPEEAEAIRSKIVREKQKREGGTPVPDNYQFRTSFTGENEWYTPLVYIEATRQVLDQNDRIYIL